MRRSCRAGRRRQTPISGVVSDAVLARCARTWSFEYRASVAAFCRQKAWRLSKIDYATARGVASQLYAGPWVASGCRDPGFARPCRTPSTLSSATSITLRRELFGRPTASRRNTQCGDRRWKRGHLARMRISLLLRRPPTIDHDAMLEAPVETENSMPVSQTNFVNLLDRRRFRSGRICESGCRSA